MKGVFYKLGAQGTMVAVMLLLVLSPYQALIAQADIPSTDTNDSTRSAISTTPVLTAGVTPSDTTPSAGAVANLTTTPAPTTPSGGGIDANSNIGCTLSTAISNFGGTFALCLTNVVYIFTVGIGSGFAYVAAYFFDLATQLSLNGTAYALTFISTGWTTARDLANMAFLFILLFIAFQIMFSVDTANTMSTLAAVIVVALLVNFSFFFTRLVIDAGNILSIEFYNSIQAPPLSATTAAAGITSGNLPGQSTAAAAVSALGQNGNTKDLTANIMGMLQLQNLFNTTSFQSFFKGDGTTPAAGFMVTAIALTFLYIAAGIMFWLLSIMFITTGIKFLTRIVVLWFLIIFSPLAFVARAIPQFRKYFDQWRGLLISHAFYPVAFMFIFLILTNFASQLSCTVNNVKVDGCVGLINDVFNSLSAATNSSSAVAAIGYAVANVGIRLGFVIAILYLGMQAAQSVSVMGASGAAKAGNWFGGKLKSSTLLPLRAASATTGLVGRNTAGRYLKEVHERPGFAARADQKGIRGAFWQGARDVTKKFANSTYDPRNAPGTSILKKAAEAATGGGTFNVGKAATKGYMDQAKERREKEKKDKAERAAIIRDEANRKALEQIDKDIKAGAPHAPADVDRVPIAHLLKESQNKTVQDSDKFTDEEKENVKKIAEPNFKSQEIVVDELRKLNSNLLTMTSAVVDAGTAKGAVVNQPSISKMTVDLNSKLTALRNNLTGAAAGDAEDIKSDMTHVRRAIKSLRDLNRTIVNVPAQGKRNPQEIIAN
jgi:hypothetical protein